MRIGYQFAPRTVGCIAIALGLALAATHAQAAVPDPANSTCPPTVWLATDGTSCCFDVIVRDLQANPVPAATVHVDFGACAVTFCPAQPPGITVVGNGVDAFTNAAGLAHICVCATFSGSCSAVISANGVTLCTVGMNRCGPTPNLTTSWGRLKIFYR